MVVNGEEVFSEQHDFDGKVLFQSREGSGTRRFAYDSFRRTTFVYPRVPIGEQAFPMERFIWDGDDRVKEVDALPGPQRTNFVYDGLGRILQQVDPLGRVATFTHERGSERLSTEALSSGLQRVNQFDAAGQLALTTLHAPREPTDVVKSFTYSPLGKVATASISGAPFGTNNTVTLTYDSLGRTVGESNSYVNAGVIHNYDLYNQWKSSWVGSPQIGTPQMNHSYDKLGRLTSVDVRGKRLALLGYGSAGSGGPLTITYPQIDESSSLTYDGRDRLTGVDVKGPAGNLYASQHSVFGSDGILRERQTQSTTLSQPLSDVFQVDLMGAVIAENNDVANVPLLSGPVNNGTVAPYMESGPSWRGYAIDRKANIESVTTPNGTTNRTYDAEDELTSDSAATSIQYDAGDNLTKYATASSNVTTIFDPEKHPVSMDGPEGNLAYFVYDALGRRIAENEAGSWTFFVWDGAHLVAQSTGTLVYLSVPGDGLDSRLAYEEPSTDILGPGPQVYLHQDADQSVFAATDGTGVLATYTYSAFGEPHVHARSGVGASSNRFLFQGQLYDRWAATYWMRAREYYPQLGRFGSTDPIGFLGGTTNLYGFANGNPLSFIDPLGLRPRFHRSWMVQAALGLFMGYLQGAIPGAFLLPQPPISKTYLRGAAVGLALAGAVDAGTAILGGGEGTALCSTGVGCLGGGPLLVGSLAIGVNAVGDGFRAAATWEDSTNLKSADEGPGSDASGASQDAPPNNSPDGAGRQGAFNEAKRQNDIPTSQQPESTIPNVDRRGNSQPGTQYIFRDTSGNEVIIRDDAAGHNYGPGDPQNRGPHFNDPAGNHYDY